MNAVVVPADPIGPMSQAWRECVGTGRFNLALRSDYLESLALTQAEIGFRYLRGHGLLSDDIGIYRPYDETGHSGVRHSFTYADQVIDSYLQLGIKPFIELGFMPEALASGKQTVFWWKGNVTPPRDEGEWVRLVTATVRHLIDRYGFAEVQSWPIEVWNEPNLDIFWEGADQAAYFRLYEATARAIKDIDPALQVGGPAISPGSDEWLPAFADFVAQREVPVDFVSKHAYTSGPAQHVPFGTYQSLQPPSALLEQFATPRSLLADTALAGLPVHITEFNTSYRPDNPVHDTALNAAYLAPVLAAGGDVVDSFSYWTFCDVFEETNVPTSFFHGGFGMLAHRQVRKPTYHLYSFMARLGPEVLARGEDHLVTRHPDGRVAILAWAPVDVSDSQASAGVRGSQTSADDGAHRVRLSVPLAGGDGSAFALRRRVNEDAGNAWAAWRELGRPESPSERHVDLLHEVSAPALERSSVEVARGRVDVDLALARHEVTLVELETVRDETPPWLDDSRIPGYRR